ncbi:MAG: hypothetical protein NVSMB68_15780 [Thermoanaerobaculia bacterium]
MKHPLCAVVLFAFAARSHAGITYRVENITEGVKPHTFSGVAKVEGGRSRFEVTRGDSRMFDTGAVVLSSAGSQVCNVLNPPKKTYYVLDLDRLTAAAADLQKQFGAAMTMPKAVTTVRSEGSGGLVEGYPTQRWLVEIATEMMMPGASGARVNLKTRIWTTDKIPADAATLFQSSAVAGGGDLLDSLREVHARVKGFALKSETTSQVVIGSTTTTSKSHLTVSAIRHATFSPSDFVLPAGYRKVDSPIDAMLAGAGVR